MPSRYCGQERKRRRLRQLRERDGDLCWLCNRLMIFQIRDKKWSASIEHVIDRKLGGTNALENLVLAHRDCNSKAGYLTLAEKIAKHEQGLRRTRSWSPLEYVLKVRADEVRE